MKHVKVKKESKRYLLLTLSVLLIVTIFSNGSIFALNESNDVPKVIASFEETTTKLSVPIDTEIEDLKLPVTQKGTLVGAQESIDIPVTWDDNATYDKTKAGDYTFTANVGEYTYDGEMPTVIVSVEEKAIEEVAPTEKIDTSKEEENKSLISEKVSNLTNIVIDTLNDELTKIPTILPDDIEPGSRIVLINESSGTKKGHTSLQSAMLEVGKNSNSFVIVFIKDYKITSSDRVAIGIKKDASMITFTSKYYDGNSVVTSTLDWAGEWNSGSHTTFKDITIKGNSSFYSNEKKLIIDEGVEFEGPNNNNSIYGFNKSSVGDVDITVKSGNWSTIASSSSSSANVSGNVDISISGNATVGTVYPSYGKGLVKGTSTLKIDGSKDAKLLNVLAINNENYAEKGNTINLDSIALEPSIFDLSNEVSDTTLNIDGNCKIDGKRMSDKSIKIENSINLKDNATLSLGNITIDSQNANLTFGANSKIQANSMGSSEVYSVNDIEVKGANAKFLLPPTTSEYLKINGEVKGSEKLTVGFLDDKASVVGRKLVEFTNEENVNKNQFAFYRNGKAKPTYKEGIEKYYRYIVYTDYVPDDGYVYEPGAVISVGGYKDEPTDMKMKFIHGLNDSKPYKASDYGKISTRNLFAKVDGYENNKYFTNFSFDQAKPDAGDDNIFDNDVEKSISQGLNVLIDGNKLFSILSSNYNSLPSGSYKGYQYLSDGTLSLMFYLKDYGVFYYNVKIEKGTSDLEISWTYVNKTNKSQKVRVTYGGDITYAGLDTSLSIFNPGATSAVAYQREGTPAMFMYVNEKTKDIPIPAIIGGSEVYSTAMSGGLFTQGMGKTEPKTTYDTHMGIQWQYDVTANTTQKGSGGISIKQPGDIQINGNNVTYENPRKNVTAESLSVSVLNLTTSPVSINQEDWEISPQEGITVTAPDSTDIESLKSKDFEFKVEIDRSVLPGNYPIDIEVNINGKEYTTKSMIIVKRDKQEVSLSAVNEDGSVNKDAIGDIINTITPNEGYLLYKYYDSKLSWSLKNNHIITAIEINNIGQDEANLTKIIQDGFINFDEIEEDKNVQITVKPYVADPLVEAKGSYRSTDQLMISREEYHTYAIPGSDLTNVFEVNNRDDIPSVVSIPYSTKKGDTPTKVFVSSVFDGDRTDITESSSIKLPANSGKLYIFFEYDTEDVGTFTMDKTTKLSVGEGENYQERSINGTVAGKPTLKQEYGTPTAEFYSTAEDGNFNNGILNHETYFNGAVGYTSNASQNASYTGKKGDAYYDETKKFTTSPNNMLLNHYVYTDSSLISTDNIEKKKGIYRIKMELRDMQFDEKNTNTSTPLNHYINMLDSKDFTNLKISDKRNAYVDADKAIVSADTAASMVNDANEVDKAEFVLKHKVSGATINPSNGEGKELSAQAYTISINEEDRKKINGGIPGVYEVTIATTGNGVNQASISTTLTVVPNGKPSSDGSRLISASPTIVTSDDAKKLTENDNAGLISALKVKTWLVDKKTGTLTEDKGLPQITIDSGIKEKIDIGTIGEYRIEKIASQGSGDSQAIFNNLEYLIVVENDAVISGSNDLYIWAKDKMVDTNNIKEIMLGKLEEEVKKLLMDTSLMNVITKNSKGESQEDNVKVVIKNGGTFKDIQDGKVGEYEIEYTSTEGGETVIITKKLTIIDNNAIWGVDIPKNIMLREGEKSSEVSLIGKGGYVLNDFTEEFSVNVQIKTKNGLALTKDGEEITATTPERNIGRYQFTGPDANSPTKNPGIGAILMEKSITKDNPTFEFKTKVCQKPLPIGNYKDILTYTFTANGLAIDEVKP